MIFPIVFVQILSNLPLLFVNFQFTVNIFKNIYKNQNHLEKPTKKHISKKPSNSNNKNNKPYKNNKKTKLCKKTKNNATNFVVLQAWSGNKTTYIRTTAMAQ